MRLDERDAPRWNYCLRSSSGPAIVLATPRIAEPATLTPVSTTVPTTLTVVDTAVPAMDRTVHPVQDRSSNSAAVIFLIEMGRFGFEACTIAKIQLLSDPFSRVACRSFRVNTRAMLVTSLSVNCTPGAEPCISGEASRARAARAS